MRGGTGYYDLRADASKTVKNCPFGTGTENLQADANGQTSLYVAAATLIESPEAAKEMAWPTVLQAVVGDVQALLLLPLTPLTYHVLAEAAELIRHKTVSSNVVVVRLVCFTIFSSSSRQLRWT